MKQEVEPIHGALSAYMGNDADSHRNSDVRGILGPLSEVANRTRCAVVLISHLNKNRGMKAIYRTTGSLAFVAAARAGWLVCRDNDDPEERLMLCVKNNLARERTGLAFEIVDGVVHWHPEPVTIGADGRDGSVGVERPGFGRGPTMYSTAG